MSQPFGIHLPLLQHSAPLLNFYKPAEWCTSVPLAAIVFFMWASLGKCCLKCLLSCQQTTISLWCVSKYDQKKQKKKQRFSPVKDQGHSVGMLGVYWIGYTILYECFWVFLTAHVQYLAIENTAFKQTSEPCTAPSLVLVNYSVFLYISSSLLMLNRLAEYTHLFWIQVDYIISNNGHLYANVIRHWQWVSKCLPLFSVPF